MVHQDPDARQRSKRPCIYWSGTACTATSKFTEDDISCYHESNCNGFGTCRGCSKYDQGGLKLSIIDNDGNAQQPMNLTLYNIRAKVKTCCHWEGEPGTFTASTTGAVSPKYDSDDVDDVIGGSDTQTSCTLSEAAPWHVAFTDDNPSAYGCNGAKSECPYYTGPKFTELIDAKMDTGDRVTAKQVLELRFYSADWASLSNPREEYEKRFSRPDIWAWAKDNSYAGPALSPGKLDQFSKPMVQRVSISDLSSDTPTFTVDPAKVTTTGTPVFNQPPAFPDLVRELEDAAASMSVLWPRGTTATDPYERKTFTESEMFMFISVQLNTDREAFAINLTKHAQNNDSDSDFVKKIRQLYPEDITVDTSTGMPGETFVVPLHLDGNVETLNHIRVFLDTGSSDGSMLTADVYIDHVFHHAEVAQTYFVDKYGHTQVDPWINKFTDIEIKAEFKHLTNNTTVHDVLWNTVASNGKKTIVALERSKFLNSGSNNLRLTWLPIGCASVVVTLLDKEVNRVYPWRAWGEELNGEEIGVWLDRSSNPYLTSTEEENVKLELSFSSTKGTAIPANVAIFKLPTGKGYSGIDKEVDKITVRYAYTEYVQGPLTSESEEHLKYNSDLTNTITSLPYEIGFTDTDMTVEGTFVRVGDLKIRSCEDVLGDCFTRKAADNELDATSAFFAGGVGEDDIKTVGEMQTECRDDFDSKYGSSLFDDSTPVSYAEAVDRLSELSLQEGSYHYNIVFSDRDGRPIGTKRVGFLTQSSLVQTRDVEIKYKWGAHMQHYPTRAPMFMHARFHEPTFATRERMLRYIYEYEPECGDHKETTIGLTLFTDFDLQVNKKGALWYPYKQCLPPRYHVLQNEWWSPIQYSNRVEGFYEHKRSFYWERMRFFDQYTPSIMNTWGQVGCFWSEYTTTANAKRPVMFTGYTKVRSDHMFGAYATDRESLRVSRHWEKRQLKVREETILQDSDGGMTFQLTPEYADILLDANGNLNEGADTATPIWSHISDGYSVVVPTSETLNHPFSRYLLSNVGNYTYSEIFEDTKRQLADVFIERDHTSNTSRATDGSVVYVPEVTTSNTTEGELNYTPGREISLVFSNAADSWAWMATPEQPLRSTSRVTGVSLSNVGYTFFKKNRVPATHPEDGAHTLKYTAHTFSDTGALESPATLSLDGGPEWNISQTDGQLYVSAGSPYLAELHENEEHAFILYGPGPGGTGLLADSRGLQLFEVAGQKKSTYAGVVIDLVYDISELPYESVYLTEVSRLSDGTDTSPGKLLLDFSTVYEEDDLSPKSVSLDFLGHYYIEEVTIIFKYGISVTDVITDIPVVNISGKFKVDGSASPLAEQDISSTSYVTGSSRQGLHDKEVTFNVNQRLFSLDISLGARVSGSRTVVDRVRVKLREHGDREEEIVTYGPTLQTSSAIVGTHKPSDLEFYFQRVIPDFSKNYEAGTIAISDLNPEIYDVVSSPVAEVKYLGRTIKDLIPMFNFTGFDELFPYDNIDLTAIAGYTEGLSRANQVLRYIDPSVLTSSKGWTLSASKHYSDPSSSKIPTDSGPEGIPNVQNEIWPNEDLQKHLYDYAGSLLGTTTVYNNFWHPAEKEFFLDKVGINLSSVSWELHLQSAVAPIERVFRDVNYGCHLPNTNEDLDGKVHKIPNWQAKGVFHYLCDPKYSWDCLTVVMDKCNEFLFDSYGTSEYLDNNVVDRFSYKFEFPPDDRMAYISRGLVVTNGQGGYVNNSAGAGLLGSSGSQFPTSNQVFEKYDSELGVTGVSKYN